MSGGRRHRDFVRQSTVAQLVFLGTDKRQEALAFDQAGVAICAPRQLATSRATGRPSDCVRFSSGNAFAEQARTITLKGWSIACSTLPHWMRACWRMPVLAVSRFCEPLPSVALREAPVVGRAD